MNTNIDAQTRVLPGDQDRERKYHWTLRRALQMETLLENG